MEKQVFIALKIFYVLLIIYSLAQVEGLFNDEHSWFRNEVTFSNWRNAKQVEYSTNKIVTDWYSTYSKGQSKYYRYANMKEIQTRLMKGDTITVGLDYYALTPISAQYFDENFLYQNYYRLAGGEVITVKMWAQNNMIKTLEF